MRVMLDTNVVVSGLFFNGNERTVLNMILHNEVSGVISETALRECREVIESKFNTNANKSEALRLLALLELSMEIVSNGQARRRLDEAKAAIRDSSDASILSAALEAEPDVLVTGDPDFFHLLKTVPLKIRTCPEFLKETGRA